MGSHHDYQVVRESKIILSNNNYTLWLLPIKAKIYKLKALNIVTGTATCPDPEKDKDNFKLYNKLNEDAYTEIVQYLNQEVLAYVRDGPSASGYPLAFSAESDIRIRIRIRWRVSARISADIRPLNDP
ncbi:hypothetical protein PGTUg99_002684 [Puccinia graminis f. sp. tritici]|uniref:Retrotransposon Copia-like N-terminal domain-containing protein n=1 Tax=Puccinia graminis f. sp. tritici TaxID=56615 RepID=A0A5B0Q3F6_PUCGR|nr:hypothetical protein PGTUg99_002684 [Puccinia graminis f. sp. tritici]